MEDKIPTIENWGNFINDLDVEYSYKIFAGKTNNEMQKEFRKNVMERAFDLRWMPIVPFQYYIFGLKQYIDSGSFGFYDKPDAANCFIGVIEYKIDKHPDHVKPIIHELISTLNYIADHQDFFDADIEIYGDFKSRINYIKQMLL